MPPTHDYIISNGTGSVIRADINNALSAIVSNNSSNSEPATKYAYMWWADTSAGLLKIRNSANDDWITLFQLDGTLTLEDGSNSAPAISFRDDTNTGIFSSAADNLDITTGGTTRVNVSSTGINVTGTVTDDGATHDGDVTFTGASANIIFDKSDNALEFADTSLARFGNSNDLAIYHSGSQSFIQDAGTGGLFILGSRVEIGNSGGSESGLVFTQNGSVDLYHNNVKVFETTSTGITVNGAALVGGNIEINQDAYFKLGASNDLSLTHTGTDSYIQNVTGDLYITNTGTNSDDIFIKSADNIFFHVHGTETGLNITGDGAVDLFFDGSKKFETTSTGITVTAKTQIEGGSGDTELILKRTNTAGSNGNAFGSIKFNDENDNNIGRISTIRSTAADDGDIRFETRPTGGSLTERLRILSAGNVQIPADDQRLQIGASQDLELYHSSNNSIINNSASGFLFIQSNNLAVRSTGQENMIVGTANGSVDLYYDNNKKLETLSNGAKITGTFVPDGDGNRDLGSTSLQWQNVYIDNDLFIGDNGKAIFGDGSDLQIYHDGTDSYIQNTTNDLFIDNNGDDIVIRTVDTIFFQVNNTENTITAKANGAVELYYDNAKKFETTSTGGFLTGNLGIGNTSFTPSTSLHINNSGSSTQMRIENGNADFLIQAGDAGSDGLHFYDLDNTAYRMTIANDGNVGIGNTSPSEKLDVAGNITTTGQLTVSDDIFINVRGKSFKTSDWDIFNTTSGNGLSISGGNSSSVKVAISSGGDVNVAGGITFGSDTAAANELDDYEEGVFTPSLEFGGATTGITYSSMRGGSYTKIGRQVTVNFGFTLTSKGSASGDATLAGLPFAVEDIISGTSVEASGVSSFWNDVATDSANIIFAATNSSSELQIRHTVGAEDDTDDMTEGDFENNTAIRGSITYFTAT
tara:strand:- start:26 stop:2797 length:2772 start_codon:yes stop_codon:yes gene_type:complete